ncbi:hypothetical protein HFZ78_18230 [Priestia megaterium]|uniref:Uncharacterized protein n=1 Tax=Priestia megaterium TaxID=1404 RepID=A0A6H1P4P2_PRIMG|nr:hypothetical protein [Priestia megaterium]QIZ08412.1 hypothetical protein HFZ78_18230 [Priestia megaterium]
MAIISTVAGTATAMERERGFLQAIKKYPNIRVIDIKFKKFTFDIERYEIDHKLITLEKQEDVWKIVKVEDPK